MTDKPPAQPGSELETLLEWADLKESLQTYTVPPAPDRQALIAQLRPLVEARQPGRQHSVFSVQHWLMVMRGQLIIIEPSFWIASAIVFMIGLGVGWFGNADTLPILLTYLAPLLGAAGVAYVFRPSTEGLRELERISPIRPLELLYARLLPVLCCDGLITLGLLLLIAARTPDIVLWRVLLVWIGPMLALTALALYSVVRWGNIAGVAIPIACWFLFLFLGSQQVLQPNMIPFDLTAGVRWWWRQANGSNGMLIGSGVSVLMGLLMFAEAQRMFAQSQIGEP